MEASLIEHMTTRYGTVRVNATTSVHNIRLQYRVGLNEYFVLRTSAWFKIVRKEGIGIMDL